MMLLVQHEDPIKAAKLVPERLKFKQLIELGQLICSAGISDCYIPIPQGKELQIWVTNNKEWTFKFMNELFLEKVSTFKNEAARNRCNRILQDLSALCLFSSNDKIRNIVFRYSKNYKYTKYATNSSLPIKEGVIEYKRYIKWKEEMFYAK